MALELFLGPVVEVALSKVISLATEQINLGVGYKKDLDSFCTRLNMVKDLLFDAEQKQGASAVKTWLKKLREIADEADAVMDEIAYEALRRKVTRKQKLKRVSNFFSSSSNSTLVRQGMAKSIKKLNDDLTELSSWASELGLQRILGNKIEIIRHRELIQQTDSLLSDPSRVIGRDVDVQNIVNLLIDSSKFDQPLGVVSIVGVGGLGKTTLAKLVCNNKKIKGHFNKIMWVCVSEMFDDKIVLGEMLESLTSGPRMDIKNQDTLVQMIKKELQEKNYLLVLDDVWDVDGSEWVSLRDCLMGITASVGSSRVLVTTRLGRVATMMRSVCGSFQKLGDDDCWSIIQQQAFGSSLVPAELEAIGKKIAIKCRGMPLVANSIGGTLYNCRNKGDWLSIEKKLDATGDDGVLQALKLSFDRLPIPALKQCVAFCSFFPKDFVMRKQMLIQLWMAEGFLEALDSSLEMEDVGENYFKDLVSYSFFQDVVWDSYGSIVSCKLHDFMHDLAKSVSKSEILVLEEDNGTIDFGDIRHLNLTCAPSMAPTKTIEVFQELHSLFMKFDISCDTSINFKKLMALSFRGSDISELPCFLGKLKRLRYLDVSETKIKEIPKFINQLYMLQTFRFMNCRRLEKPPEEIENLVSLKHIYYDDKKHMPAGIGSLTCLQTLELFAVGHEMGYQIQELEHLSKLRGKLEICNLENIRNREDAGRANLCKKAALVELALVFGSDLSVDQCKHHCDILEGLEPHSNLKGLFLKRYRGEKCPSWMSNCVGTMGGLTYLSNLSMMKLYDCPHLETIPSLSLSKEAVLEIRECKSLKSIEVSLVQRLIISDCVELALLQFGPLVMKHLKEICIKNCGKLENLPMVSSLSGLEILKLENCFNLKSIVGESSSSPKSLRELRISYCYYLTSIPSLDGCVSLERIRISYCQQLKSIDGKKLSSCMSLREFCIRDCSALTSIPSLDRLLSLQRIHISGCSKLKSIKKESLSLSSRLKEVIVLDWHALTSLSILHGLSCLVEISIIDCKRLKSISGESLSSATRLKKLSIHRCPALTSIPSLDGLSSLEEISISRCQQLRSIDGESLSTSTRLKEFTLGNCPALTYIPSLDGLSRLQSLYIRDCGGLTSLPNGLSTLHNLTELTLSGFSEDMEEFLDLSFVQCLTALRSLSICNCGALTRLPDGLSSLRRLSHLELGGFPEDMEEFPDLSFIQHLDFSLKDLTLVGWEKLKHLPHQIQCLKNLTDLTIRKFDGLEVLPDWLGNLSSLKCLSIANCKSLMHMPSQEAIQCLSRLKHLDISNCPELEPRCASESSSEWDKISHIRRIKIKSNQQNEPEIGTTSSVSAHDNDDDREQESETTSVVAAAACDDQQSESTAANVDDDEDERETNQVA